MRHVHVTVVEDMGVDVERGTLLVLGSDGNGNEAMVVTLRMPVSHEDVHDSLPSTSVRLVVFGNNSSMQRPPEGRERDIYDGWAAQQETGFRIHSL